MVGAEGSSVAAMYLSLKVFYCAFICALSTHEGDVDIRCSDDSPLTAGSEG